VVIVNRLESLCDKDIQVQLAGPAKDLIGEVGGVIEGVTLLDPSR
jgi:hypothetical protein